MSSEARIARWASSVAVLLVLVGASTDGHAVDRTARPLLRVLFIGNSYTRFNDLPRIVASLSESAEDGPIVRSVRETHGGYDLRGHWRRREVRRRLSRDSFDAIVIQGHSLSPIREPEQMEEYAGRFAERASELGARLILFETWARHPRSRVYRRYHLASPEDMLDRVESVYARIGRDLNAAVSPVGRAWERALAEAPDVRLFRRDGTHPTLAGSYLAACVLYGTLTGEDPRDATWAPWRLPRRDAATIRSIAAESLGVP